jgi:hypothetical protein
MSNDASTTPSPTIEQIRADVARAEALLEQIKQLVGVTAGVSFGDIDPARVGAEPTVDATDRVRELSERMQSDLSEAVAGMPWLVQLTEEERERARANAPPPEVLAAMHSVVELLSSMSPEEFDEASRNAASETGHTMTRAELQTLRDNLERMDLMQRLRDRTMEIARMVQALADAELEAAEHEAAELIRAKAHN